MRSIAAIAVAAALVCGTSAQASVNPYNMVVDITASKLKVQLRDEGLVLRLPTECIDIMFRATILWGIEKANNGPLPDLTAAFNKMGECFRTTE
ncbi:MAG TPA: hypothetical protein VHD31_02355 [Candidatus Paceibacterota bacterium]|nr:hypothetical protein [Candidatus Paceibacterota bacterium]